MKSDKRGFKYFVIRVVFACLVILAVLFPLPAYSSEIVGWGIQKTPNAPLTNLTKIAAGGFHSLALKSDGSIVGWGYNFYGQATPPAGNDFLAVTAGEYHSLALKSDGSIVFWGYNGYVQATPPAGNNFIAVAAGCELAFPHNLALKSDGSIVGWGNNNDGQATPPVDNNNFVAIAAGRSHSLALKSDGSIVGWGNNYYGQATPPEGNDFTAVAAGYDHSLALKSDGSIVGWGWNGYGQATPPEGNDFTAVAAGYWHSLALKSDGSIVSWGWNEYGQATPPDGNDFIAVAAGYTHSLALKSDGSIVGWGHNYIGETPPTEGNDFIAVAAGQLHSLALKSDGSIVGWGRNDNGEATPPVDNNNFVAIAAGGRHSLALKSDGSIVGWGNNEYGGQATPPTGNDFIAVAAGEYHSLALKSDGSIVGWGGEYYGESTPPVDNNNFVAIAAGRRHSLALKSDGSIVGWGNNYNGQATPPAGNNFVAVAAGYWHSLALKSDGSIVGWGNNGYGPATPPADNNNFIAVAAGATHSLALKADGTIVGWGDNYSGQATPPAGNNFTAVAAGYYCSLALKGGRWNEISSAETTLAETLNAEQWTLEDGNVVGDLNGTFDFNSFDIVLIKTGPWAGKGFSKAQCQATLEGITYVGNCKGAAVFKPDANSIYLNGSITGDILATVEGTLTESIPGSGVYDQYQATWKIGRLGGTIISATVKVTGTLTNHNSAEYPATGLYVLQTAMDGNLAGDLSGSLSTVINHVRIADGNNPYNGKGFSIISYVSQFGSGQGYTCDQLLGSGIVTMNGLFTDPLYGVLSASLNETTTPRSLYLSLQRIDLGLPPAPDLKVKTWGPQRVSPGQTIDYIVEYRNDGLKAADDAIVFYTLDPSVNHVSSSTGGSYNEFYGTVSWNLGPIPPKAVRNMSVKVGVAWGLPMDTELDNFAYIINIEPSGMKTSVMEAQDNTSVMFVNGINNNPTMYPAFYKKSNEFATTLGADTVPGLFESGSEVTDVIDVQKATPNRIVGYFLGIPLVNSMITGLPVPALPGYQIISNMLGNDVDYLVYPNTNNGLAYWNEHGSTSRDTLVAFSGGTRSVLTGILIGTVKCERLVLISPMAGWGDMGHWKKEIERIQQLRVDNHQPKMEIVIYQSYEDILPTKYLTGVSQLFQVKFDPIEKTWLVQNNVKVNPGTAEFGFNAPLVVDVLVDGKIVKREIKIDETINKQNHGGLFQTINRILKGKDGVSSSASSTITTAYDPSIKYGPEGNVLPGQKLNYRIEYENEGEGIAFGVYFTDTLDEDLNDATLEIGPIIDVNTGEEIAPPGNYNPATRTITWFAGEVGPGQGGYSDVNICVRSDANDGTEIINYATIYFPSVPEETRTNGIVSIVSLNQPPTANAGEDISVHCGPDGIATVQLDGSGSSDADNDPLSYRWNWAIDGQSYNANGVNPTIQLPLGAYEITLIVNDGIADSQPDAVIVTVYNTPPIANAGITQTVYAWIDGIADVNLDGSASYDNDNDSLTYKWKWTIDGNTYEANGVKPTIELPVGQHVISLIVNDGLTDSEPNDVNITVIGPVEGNLNITPEVLNCKSNQKKITAKLCLPKGITKEQIDATETLLLYPGQIKADKVQISQDKDKYKIIHTTIQASFDKDELMDAIPDKGQVELVVVGQLKTGQYFFGTDNIRVICPGKWPWHKPWWNYRWNRWHQRPFNCRH
jgi:uncharacterized repeat protein (TIGR01451 family)